MKLAENVFLTKVYVSTKNQCIKTTPLTKPLLLVNPKVEVRVRYKKTPNLQICSNAMKCH